MMDKFLKQLEMIATDRKRGAAQLFIEAVKTLVGWSKERGESHPEEFISILKATANTQPSMAPMLNLVNSALLGWEEEGIKGMTRRLEAPLESSELRKKQLVQYSYPILAEAKRVITLSFSSTVLEALKGVIKRKRPRVVVSQGTPLMGGTRMARILHDLGAEVYLCVDALLPSLLKKGDAVIVGADAITLEGLVNRCGSYPLALTALDREIPFYSLTGMEKFLPQGLLPYYRIEDRDPSEVLPNAPFPIIHRYFDETPLRLLTGLVTENGILAPPKVEEILRGLPVSKRIKEVLGG